MSYRLVRFFKVIILTSALNTAPVLASPTGLLGALLGWMSAQPDPSFPVASTDPSPWNLDLSLQNNLLAN